MLPAYFVFSVLMTSFIYPVVVAWTWGGGWLTALGFHDFAGTGIVHMVGGVAGFVGALIIKPRHGKERRIDHKSDIFEDPHYKKLEEKYGDAALLRSWIEEVADDTEFEPHSIPFVVFGTIVLWVSWLFFNGGSTADMYQPRANGISKIMMNTIISGAAGGLVASFLKPWVMKSYSSDNRYDVASLANGLLAGLVAITGVCDRVDPWAAFIIGIIGGVVYSLACKFCHICHVDDPIEASSVHGFTGMWGLIATGFFDNEEGLFSGADDGKLKYLGVQILGMFAIILWVAVLSSLYFLLMKKLGLLRVSLLEEVIGLDIAEMGSQLHISKKVDDELVRSASLRKVRRMSSVEKAVTEFNNAEPF